MNAVETLTPVAGVAAQREIAGYLHPDYCGSLSEFGEPLQLPRSGGRLLVRPIPGSDRRDAMGPYPLLTCNDWSALADDLAELEGGLVSVAVVTDPFGNYEYADLETAFPDRLTHFKEHYIVDLEADFTAVVTGHHRRNARAALEAVGVDIPVQPFDHGADWVELYNCLIERHGITGITAFSPGSLQRQLAVPGAVLLRALEGGRLVGMTLWYRCGDIAYYHLGAYNERGYELKASFALFSRAIEYFATEGLRRLNLGGGAGVSVNGEDGLSRFKRGWATGTLPVWFGGRITDPEAYRRLSRGRSREGSQYFPVYRSGEFN